VRNPLAGPLAGNRADLTGYHSKANKGGRKLEKAILYQTNRPTNHRHPLDQPPDIRPTIR
jgi:hypothetical protein